MAIIGGGSAALFLAAFLDEQLFEVHIYEQNKTLGRKFLVAGDGGFNLTHGEAMETFVQNYTPDGFLKKILLEFDNAYFQKWLAEIGVPTFVGSSKRIFPEKGIKPIAVLNAILKKLEEKGVQIHTEQTWSGWNAKKAPIINGKAIAKPDYTVFALGGGSWKVTGSDGNWLDTFAALGIETLPFQSSNCGFGIDWPSKIVPKHEGAPLKNISISCGEDRKKGEVVITKFGLEGNAIYALSPQIRSMLASDKKAAITLDVKPTTPLAILEQKIKDSKQRNTTEILRQDLKLSAPQLALVKTFVSKEAYIDQSLLAQSLKKIPLVITGMAPTDEAISTTGGIAWEALGKNFQLKKNRNQYCIGEMLDWDAPTGGYLLQACFSMGAELAKQLNLKETPSK